MRIIHFDDSELELELVRQAISDRDIDKKFTVLSVSTTKDFQKILSTAISDDVFLLDIHTDVDGAIGLEFAKELKSRFPGCTVIMRSSIVDPVTITTAIRKARADEYISKDASEDEIYLRIVKAVELKGGFNRAASGGEEVCFNFVGNTMKKISTRVPAIVDSAIQTVFVSGESGAGKEVVVQLFEDYLGDNVPFVKVNCGAITETLLESELFGHVKGAFTGATQSKDGYFKAAEGGFIFLDEVATLSGSAQVALLRVLENHELIPVGATKSEKINVRVLSATNEPIEEMIQERKFRGDLWQRLNEATIEIPPLRERPEEIRILAEYFAEKMRGGPYSITEPAMQLLSVYDWKDGNVRELRNCLRAMTEKHVNKTLSPLAIPNRIFDKIDMEDSKEEEILPIETSNKDANELVLKFAGEDGSFKSFDELSTRLVIELTHRMYSVQKEQLSMRALARGLDMSRTALKARLNFALDNGMISLEEIRKLVNI